MPATIEHSQSTLEVAQTPTEGANALVELGIAHLEQREYTAGLKELWAGMHGHTGMNNIAISLAGITAAVKSLRPAN